MHYERLKSYQFLFEGNVKKLESKSFENKTYVRANVLHSMEKTPYWAVLECHLPVMCYAQRVRTLMASVSEEKESATTSEECCLLLKILEEEGSKITQSH